LYFHYLFLKNIFLNLQIFYISRIIIFIILNKIRNILNLFYFKIHFTIMGIGDWGLGIGDWAPIPNPQSPIGDWGLGPIPNPQSPIPNRL
jgi:hypothetical protein